MYTEDISKKSQHLALSDKDLMAIFINGLHDDIKNPVILNQPDSFAEAEILPHLRGASLKTSGVSISLAAVQSSLQEQQSKDLEGHMSLLISPAGQKKCNVQTPVSHFGTKSLHTPKSLQPATVSAADADINPSSINTL